MKKQYFFDLFCLSLSIGILFGFMLGCRALSVPDEARYTEIPREMLLFHDFITPHLNGVLYFEKPPLLYWIQSAVIALFGINEWALRLPTASIALLGCLATYTAGRLLFDRVVGLFAAGILATSPLYFAMAHSITLDMTVSVCLTLTLFSFIIAMDFPQRSCQRRLACWLMYMAAALAVLTKGLIGILLPGIVIFSWLLIFHRWKELAHLYLFSGIFIFLLIVLPWHILVQLKNPSFFHFYFIEQQFTRYLTKALGRYKPFWWFLPILIAGLFPWIVFLPKALINVCKTTWVDRPQKQKEIFLLLWAVEIFLFFSLSDSKLIPYILPVLPPLGVLIAICLKTRITSSSARNASDKAIFLLAFLLSLVLLTASFWHHTFSSEALFYLHLSVIPLILMGAGAYWINAFRWKIAWIFFMQIALLWSLVAAMPVFDLRPIKPLALALNALAKPQDIVASYGLYYQDLPVYTKRIVLIVDWKNELSFGYAHQNSAKHWMIEASQFWKIWQGPQRVFALMDEDDYQRSSKSFKLFVLAKHDDDLLVSNQP